MFSMLVHRKALKEIDEFPTEDKQRILSAIRQIAAEPFSGDHNWASASSRLLVVE